MTEPSSFRTILIGWFVLAVAVFIILFFITVPYGRYTRRGWGPGIGSRLGWFIMESVSALGFAVWFILGEFSLSAVPIVFFILWEIHYVHRAFIYPWRMREKKQSMPVLIVCFAFLFNAMNCTMNGRYLFSFSGGYSPDWFTDIRFISGVVLFLSGFSVNYRSDRILLKLRNSSEMGYRIPHGGLYRWVCCPNYLGEIIEWFGWALATWSLPGLVFAVWTMANLVPRARSNDRWYREHFPDYPQERKILIPGVW